MSRQGLLSVQYADNIPWFVSVTDLGESVLKLGGWFPSVKGAACLLTVATTLIFTVMHRIADSARIRGLQTDWR